MSEFVSGKTKQAKLPVVIMAGGLGKRAREISEDLPKPLIPIAGKPILEWEISCLVSQGYTEIILTVSYLAEKIMSYFGDGSAFGCHISYYEEKTPLGNAGALFKLMESHALSDFADEDGDADFLLLNADSMFDIDFDRFVAAHRRSGALATLFVHPNNHPYDSGLIISDEEGWVTRWLTKEDERPKYYKNLVNAGVHVLNTKALRMSGIDGLSVGEPVGDGKVLKVDLDRQILKPLASSVSGKRLMYAYASPEYVKDMGTPERFAQVQADLESGLVQARNLSRPQKAVFLDRDGVINKFNGFVRTPDTFELIPGVAEAIRKINDSGYLCIVITNQPVIARGEVTTEELHTIFNKMETLLGEKGAYVDGIYYCPHHPDKGFEGEVSELKIDCDCRKPKTGLLERAAADYHIDLKQSIFVGDSWRDIACGKSAGCTCIFLNGEFSETPHKSFEALEDELAQKGFFGYNADGVFDDLKSAERVFYE